MTPDLLVGAALLVPLALAVFVGVAGLRHRRDPAGRWLSVLCLGIAGWAGAQMVAVMSTDPDVQRVTLGASMTSVTVLVIALTWWTMIVTGRSRVLGHTIPFAAALPGIVPAAVMWLGNPGNAVMSIVPSERHMLPELRLHSLGILHVAWSYALASASLLALMWLAQAMPRRQRPWLYALAGSITVPLLVNVVMRVINGDNGPDLTILATSVSLVTLALAVPRLRMLDVAIGLLPVARDEVVEAMSEGVVVVDRDNRVLDINPAGSRLLDFHMVPGPVPDVSDVLPGWDPIPGERTTWDFIAPGSDPPRVVEARAEPLRAHRAAAGTLVLLRDITRQHNAQAALERSVAQHVHASRHDPLTGLPNRVLLFSELRAALSPNGRGCALFILDLNGFKGLNDTFGHRSGDRVLRDLGARLESTLNGDVVVARLGGDEFAVMTPDTAPESVTATAERILGAFQMPFRVADTDVMLGASVGAAVGPKDGQDADDLVHAADVAMYHAKRTAGRWAMYAPGLDARRPEQLMLRHELRRAIEADELVIYYQPLAARDGSVRAVEALVRWRHPARGLLTPDQFLPVIEDTDLMCRLTDVVLDKAVRQAAAWVERGVGVAVNLSALDLRDPDLPARVSRVLQRYGLGAASLTLEITENALSGTRESASQLEHLRDNGVRVALDDFGTGIGPLSSLRDLAVDEIKIDRSFVSAMVSNPRDTALVGGLIRLGHDLGLAVVAEGVESDEERRLLRSMGCDRLQGYLIGRPVPAESNPLGPFVGLPVPDSAA